MRNKESVEKNSEGCAVGQTGKEKTKKKWRKPKLEDVSGKVMAQPYIRFT
jgi:hypothetical protein